jgi:hypothetical protein
MVLYGALIELKKFFNGLALNGKKGLVLSVASVLDPILTFGVVTTEMKSSIGNTIIGTRQMVLVERFQLEVMELFGALMQLRIFGEDMVQAHVGSNSLENW